MNMERHRVWGLLGLGLSFAMGCSATVGEDVAVRGEPLQLAFTPFEDPEGVGPGGESPVRRVIYSARQYERAFGHAPPSEVDFAGGEIVVFYSAGIQRTGGYEATIESIDRRRGALVITTRLSSPGPNCAVTDALTHPYALVKLERPRGYFRVRFESDDVVEDCDVPPNCDLVDCPDGQHCEMQQLFCVTAPCPEVPVCVPNPPFCGGIAGIPCPGGGQCVDDPSDDCDPERGGADCGGLCSCEVQGLCEKGYVWDDSPQVCDCVPDGPSCGGFAGIPCPGAGMCIDDPSDACDPEQGGADCGGICACNAIGLCQPPLIWDSSPFVCGCVNPCAAVLCPTGTQCEVLDGAPVCTSNGALECGNAVCGPGLVCCNASCGICTPPDGFCTQQACIDPE